MRILCTLCLLTVILSTAAGVPLSILGEMSGAAEPQISVFSFEDCCSLGADTSIWPELRSRRWSALEVVSWADKTAIGAELADFSTVTIKLHFRPHDISSSHFLDSTSVDLPASIQQSGLQIPQPEALSLSSYTR